MEIKNENNHLAPTYVEKPLVAAIAEHRDEWPYIYLEMRKVVKDDLLLDAEYCARHKHPSLTNFYEECGKIGGIHISMLRKIQRAGTYYESAGQRHSSLPSITCPGVCALSPDTLTLVAKIVHLIGRGGAKTESIKYTIERSLLRGLVEGNGLSRKQLNAWYGYLDDSIYSNTLNEAVKKFDAFLKAKDRRSGQSGMVPKSFYSRVRAALESGDWLKSTASKASSVNRRLRVEDTRGIADDANFSFSLMILEAVNGSLSVHAMVLCQSADEIQKGFPPKLKDRLLVMGFDFIWVVCEQGSCDLSTIDLTGFGLIRLEGETAKVLSDAPKLHAAPDAQRNLYATFLLRSLDARNL